MNVPRLTSELSELPPAPPIDMAEYEQLAIERKQQRKQRRRKGMAVVAVGAMTFLSGAGTALKYDIQQGKEQAAEIHPTADHIYNPVNPADNNKATIVLTGFNTQSSVDATKLLQAHAEEGHVFAVNYGSSINIDEYVATIQNALQEEEAKTGVKIRYLSVDGYSMGGLVLSAAAADIQLNNPGVDIVSVTMNSTPIGKDGLAEQVLAIASSFAGKAANVCFNELKICDGLQYSRTAQGVAELYSDKNSYLLHDNKLFDLRGFIDTLRSINNQVADPNVASPALAYDQAAIVAGVPINFPGSTRQEFLSNYSMDKIVEALSTTKDGIKPVIHYTMAEKPSTDHIVNVVASAAELQALAEKHQAKLQIVGMDVSHFNVFQRPILYNTFIKKDVIPSTRATIDAAVQASNQKEANKHNYLAVMAPRRR